MARALRPAVLLMLLASALFLIAGILDGASGAISYAFGAVNLIVAVLIARGSERVLALRIGLAAFFVLERLASALLFGPKSIESVGVHVLTAAVEAVILASTLRLWRLGHSVTSQDLAFLSLSPEGAAVAAGGGGAVAAMPSAATATRKAMADRVVPVIAPRLSWLMGLLALLLAALLVGDAAVLGVGPDLGSGASAIEGLVFLFAVVVLIVAARAVHGRPAMIRLLLIVALIELMERAFTPMALRITDPASLGLHYAAALVALGLALTSAAALQSRKRPA